ncbi:UDP-glucose/GDP-mannose dehydrogenase family protein [Candidatus Bathyarchaeota archaeon]|nr:UDP-glucose/GDP-mannose dehydrogenase family protein [Candidatus Bathyarchaeota archaeon]
MYRVSFVGLGPVGLCTAVCFATKDIAVIGSEMDTAKVKQIKSINPPFYEPNLKELLHKAIRSGNLKIVTNNEEAVLKSDITFITVGTPSNRDGSISLQYVIEASEEIGKALKKKTAVHLVAIKSTVTAGTTLNIVKPILEKNSEKKCGKDFFLCVNPEFLSEGNAIKGTFNPDYIVIGGYNEKSAETLENLYKDFHKENLPPILKTNIPTAELIKYANNTFLATKISLINTIANICEKTPGADVTKVAEAIGKDHRINPYFLNAGLGWGGSCFPKDLKAFIAYSKKLGYNPTLIQAAYKANQDQVKFTIEKVKDNLKTLKGKKIAILGLAFKPNTDDIREARSLKIISQLLKQGAIVTAYDPMATANVKKILKKRINYASSAIECLRNADCAILVTEWEEFKKLKPKDFAENMRKPILIDSRRIYDYEKFSKRLRYIAVGLGEPLKPQP